MSGRAGPDRSRVTRGFLVLSLWTTLSRISGLLREVVMAFLFGAGQGMDAFIVAFTVPNLFRQVLAEKAIESAFLPRYKQLVARGEEDRARRMGSTILTLFTLIALVVVLAGEAVVPFILRILAPGFQGAQLTEAVRLTRICFPFLMLISWAAFVGAVHLANERFAVYSASALAFNAAIISTAALLEPWLGITAAAFAILAGGLAFFLVQVPFLRSGDGSGRGVFRYRPRLEFRDPEVRRVGRLLGPAVVEAVVNRSITIVDRMLASQLAVGAISALGFSFRIMELPLGLLGRAMGRSVQTVVAEGAGLGQYDRVRSGVLDGLRMLAFLLLPISAWTVLAADSVVGVLFRRGAFDEQAVAATAWALRFYAPALLGLSGIALLSRVFYALDDARTPLAGSVIMMLVNVGGNLLLYRTVLAHGGLALATSLGAWAACLFLIQRLRRRLVELDAPLSGRALLEPLARMIPALAGSTLTGWGAISLLRPVLPGTFIGDLLRIVGVGGLGAGAFIALATLTRCEEARRLGRRLRRSERTG